MVGKNILMISEVWIRESDARYLTSFSNEVNRIKRHKRYEISPINVGSNWLLGPGSSSPPE